MYHPNYLPKLVPGQYRIDFSKRYPKASSIEEARQGKESYEQDWEKQGPIRDFLQRSIDSIDQSVSAAERANQSPAHDFDQRPEKLIQVFEQTERLASLESGKVTNFQQADYTNKDFSHLTENTPQLVTGYQAAGVDSATRYKITYPHRSFSIELAPDRQSAELAVKDGDNRSEAPQFQREGQAWSPLASFKSQAPLDAKTTKHASNLKDARQLFQERETLDLIEAEISIANQWRGLVADFRGSEHDQADSSLDVLVIDAPFSKSATLTGILEHDGSFNARTSDEPESPSWYFEHKISDQQRTYRTEISGSTTTCTIDEATGLASFARHPSCEADTQA